MISTEKSGLELRALRPRDAPALFALVQRNARHLTALGDYSEVVALGADETKQQLADVPDSSRVMGIFLADRLIGRVDLHSPRPGTFVLGYWIDESHCGRGFATAACRAIIRDARDHRQALEFWAGANASNLASVAVLEKLGFECVEELPTHRRFRLGGGRVDGE